MSEEVFVEDHVRAFLRKLSPRCVLCHKRISPTEQRCRWRGKTCHKSCVRYTQSE